MTQRKIDEYEPDIDNRTAQQKCREAVEDKIQNFCERYPNQVGLFLMSKGIKKKPVAVQTIDELQRYKVYLGQEYRYNFDDFMNQSAFSPDEMIPLRKVSNFTPNFSFTFSASRDAYGSLQSDHCFLSGSTGMGKTNLCSLLTVGFPRRPNPTTTLWVAQKTSTASMDFQNVENALDEIGYKCIRLKVGDEIPEGKLPISALQVDDIKKWFGMSPSQGTVFEGFYQSWKRQGGNIGNALESFINHQTGEKYRPLYESALEGNVLSFRKSDEFKFKKNRTILLDISQILHKESRRFADTITNGWCNYVYNHTSEERAKLFKDRDPDDENFYKKQWQSMILFDEYYELARTYKFENTMKTVSRIGTQGRSEGTGLVIATQTVFGGHSEKIPLSQANYTFQFLSSSMADQSFVMRNMGWEKGEYEYLVREIFGKYFPPTRGKEKDVYKGQILLFSKQSGTINAVKLKLLQ